jgi:allophanate hydrolase subunit 1
MLAPTAEAPRLQRASDQSLLIYFGHQISLDAHDRVRRLVRLLELEPMEGLRNLHPAYCSLLIKFDPRKWRHDELERSLTRYLARLDDPDLMHVSAMHGMTPAQVIELHSSATYLVYFLGFIPGFAYLGELPDALVTPRLATPRRSVPPGSVGIAGSQTGVYPFATPGGWRLLGRTPVSMFRPEQKELSLLSIGDRVRFAPISSEQFAALEST